MSSKVPIETAGTSPADSQTRGDCVSNNSGKIGRKFGILHLRPHEDDAEQDWWFASTAIPLLAATLGPLANVLSIAALVVSWRMNLVAPNTGQDLVSATICRNNWDGQTSSLMPELKGYGFGDPHWCYTLNIVSLVCGFVGNFFLLANFTGRIRYIIALPATIISWYISTALLIGITISMNIYAPPERPCQTYTQGFWYAVIAAVLYLLSSMILMVNMLGYFLGHYPQRFILTEAQRTLILQTMLFFIWLAGGAGVFAQVETNIGSQEWLFSDALYFCDVTILTVGFGDLVPADDFGRGLVFPYSVGGIIMLGLVIGSISKFAGEMSQEKVVKKNLESHRVRTIERSDMARHVAALGRAQQYPGDGPAMDGGGGTPHERGSSMDPGKNSTKNRTDAVVFAATPKAISRRRTRARRTRDLVLHEEKARFDAMRRIQRSTSKFKNYTALTMSVIAFCVLWLAGAAIFYVTERETLHISYFQALYFCYVSLLTIGYGDLAPKSNAGRPFFVVWSLLAVPTMTILVSDMGNTVINKFKRGTNSLADFTVLPKYGVWRTILDKNPWLLLRLQRHHEEKVEKKRLNTGFEAGPGKDAEEDGVHDGDDCEGNAPPHRHVPDLEQLAKVAELPPLTREAQLLRELSEATQRVHEDSMNAPAKRYSYEEWVQFTEVIRFTSKRQRRKFMSQIRGEDQEQDRQEGTYEGLGEGEVDLIEWDWIGEDSPMMAGKSEPEFVMERLCESQARYNRWAGAYLASGLASTVDIGVGIGRSQSKEEQSSLEDKSAG